MSTKSEQPTESRLRQEREEGRIAKSKDLTQCLTGAIWIGGLSYAFVPAFAGGMQIIQHLILMINTPPESVRAFMLHAMGVMILPVAICIFGTALVSIVAALIAEQIQVRGLFSGKALKIDFTRLNPINQLKSIFSMRTLVELAKSMVKMIVVLSITLGVIATYLPELVHLRDTSTLSFLTIVSKLALLVSSSAYFALFVLSVIDVKYQQYAYIKNLRMSKDEVRRDYKQQEGDPQMKGARQQAHAELSQ